MKPEFRDAFPCMGVDIERKKPAMIVPLGGTNMVVVLGGAGVTVSCESDNIAIHEIDRAKRDASPDVAALKKLLPDEAKTGAALRHDARIFSIKGKSLRGGADGVALNAQLDNEIAVLRVVVLKPKSVKLAIGDVLVRDGTGALVRHSKAQHDVPALVAVMNLIWRPQTNITFEAVEARRVEIGETVPPDFNLQRFRDTLAAAKGDAKIGMFFVERAVSQDLQSHARPNTGTGWTDGQAKVAIIGDDANMSTMAHEAGHLLGHDGHEDPNITHLLQNGGPGRGLGKIPFDLAIGLFNGGY